MHRLFMSCIAPSDIVLLAVGHRDLAPARLADVGHVGAALRLLRRNIDVGRRRRELRVCLRVAVDDVPVMGR